MMGDYLVAAPYEQRLAFPMQMSAAALFDSAVMLALAAITLCLIAIAFVRAGFAVGALVSRLRHLASALIALGATWLALATDPTSLPVSQPGPHDQWWVLPAGPTYAAIAVLSHAFLSIVGLYVLWVIWLLIFQFDFASVSETQQLVIGVTLSALSLLLAVSWAVSAWPTWYLILADCAVAFPVSIWAAAVGLLPVRRMRLVSVGALRRYAALQVFGRDALLLTLFFVILANYQAPALPIRLFELYVLFLVLDDLVAAGYAVVRPFAGDYHFLSPQRWIYTVPLAFVFAAAGAAGLLAPLVSTEGYTSGVWLAAGTAGAAFLLFKPVTDSAAYIAGVREQRPSLLTSPLIGLLPGTGSRQQLTQRIGERPSDEGIESSTSAATDQHVTAPTVDEWGTTQAVTTQTQSQRVFDLLLFPNAVVFLVGLLGYEGLLGNSNLSGVLTSGAAPLVFGLLALFISFLQVVSHPLMAPARDTFLLLLLVIIILTGLVSVLTNVPGLQGIRVVVGSGTLDLGSSMSVLENLRAVALEMLLLLTFGVIAYLFRLVDAILRVTRAEGKGSDDPDLVRLGDLRYERARKGPARSRGALLAEAIDAYECALKKNAHNAAAWKQYGVTLDYQGILQSDDSDQKAAAAKYREADVAFQRAEELDPDEPVTRINHAQVQLRLARAEQKTIDHLLTQMQPIQDEVERLEAQVHESVEAQDEQERKDACQHELEGDHAKLADLQSRLAAVMDDVDQAYRNGIQLCIDAVALVDDDERKERKVTRHRGWIARKQDELIRDQRDEDSRKRAFVTKGLLYFEWADYIWAQREKNGFWQPREMLSETLFGSLRQNALSAMDQALEIDDMDATALNIKGLTLFYQHKTREAANVLDKALHASRNRDATIAFNLGTVREAAELRDEALQAYKLALRIDPSLTRAREGAERMRSALKMPPIIVDVSVEQGSSEPRKDSLEAPADSEDR